jgi:hypothetical protein
MLHLFRLILLHFGFHSRTVCFNSLNYDVLMSHINYHFFGMVKMFFNVNLMISRISELTVFFFFFLVLGLELRVFPWATPPSLFLWRVFQDRVSWTICLGCLWTKILLISISWVARITGMSHQHPAIVKFLKNDMWFKS